MRIKRLPKYARGYFLSLFRPQRTTFKLITYLGAKFIVDIHEDVGWLMYSFRNFEDDEVRLLSKKVKQDWNCLDVGGNIGFYSVMLAKMAPLGTVVSCEPVPRNVSMIAMNRLLNDVEGRTLVTLIGDVDTQVDFAASRDSSYASIKNTGRGGAVQQVKRVPMTTIAGVGDQMGCRFDFIKIDIEGAEEMAVKGMAKLLQSERRPRLLMLEVCDENLRAFNSSGERLVEMMNDFGYSASSIDGGKEVAGLVPGRGSQNVFFVPTGGDARQHLDGTL